eukprot:TRINITY_DN1274_c0_g1_i1.p1 TRINITY_DN1274_c0_g1~~TRINITY_DN1274_c0_g1_i1.p1  ORF type:complete len:287 (-),score=111.12 TRINITY_DN1274_c0_g1_i1:671-1531(-)
MVASLEQDLGVQPRNIDTDDYWAGKDFQKSDNVYYVTVCLDDGSTYKMTKPFETYCPLTDFEDGQQKIPINLDVSQLIFNKVEKSSKEGGKKNKNKNNNEGGGEKKKGGGGGQEISPEEMFGKAKLQISRVMSVKPHPDSDGMYVCQVDCGNDDHRQVCAGLRGFVSEEELTDALVVTINNLKPLKLRGQDSQAMILASEQTPAEGDKIVKLLSPPAGSNIGDRVFLSTLSPSDNPNKTLSKKHWGKVQPLLKVNDGKISYNGGAYNLVTQAGDVTCDAPNDTIVK